MKRKHLSRRSFMIAAAATAAGCATGSKNRPPSAPVAAGPLAANEKLNIAGIGIGGKGAGDMEQCEGHNIVALCDVDWAKGARIFERYPKAKQYKDFRVMLEKQKDIDAVVIATPDHTHAISAMTALQLGKHVYCEKPLTHTVYEARRLAEAARAAKVGTQMGNSGQASEKARLMCDYVWGGAIGPVREVHVWSNRPIWPQQVERPTEVHPVPDTLDWDLWLGPAPERPFNSIYHPFRWRGWWDFGTGALGDMGCHAFHPIFRALKLGHPTSVEATSTYKGKVNEETYPLASTVHYEFPARGKMPPVRLTWYDGGLKPPRPDALEPGRDLDDGGTLFLGDKGAMLGHELIPAAKQLKYGKPPEMLKRSPGHFEEWFGACKGGDAAGANFDVAGLVTEVVLLGNVAIRTGKKLHWDGPNMQFANMPEANQYLRREYRKGWSL
jgi:predicted dehydrogenase